ncbi:TPA: hypothetical protein EYP66_07675 [Candidatus Poribacteria bacterium]|nr:hypothetical protein [Candidatus Poribacteria bacterium]
MSLIIEKYQNVYLNGSRFAFVYRKDGYVALYHSILINIVYGNSHLLTLFRKFAIPSTIVNVIGEYPEPDREEVLEAIEVLIQSGFLVDASFNEENLIQNIRDNISVEPTITELFLLPTDQCNFRCKYCHIMNSMPPPISSHLWKKIWLEGV